MNRRVGRVGGKIGQKKNPTPIEWGQSAEFIHSKLILQL